MCYGPTLVSVAHSLANNCHYLAICLLIVTLAQINVKTNLHPIHKTVTISRLAVIQAELMCQRQLLSAYHLFTSYPFETLIYHYVHLIYMKHIIMYAAATGNKLRVNI